MLTSLPTDGQKELWSFYCTITKRSVFIVLLLDIVNRNLDFKCARESLIQSGPLIKEALISEPLLYSNYM